VAPGYARNFPASQGKAVAVTAAVLRQGGAPPAKESRERQGRPEKAEAEAFRTAAGHEFGASPLRKQTGAIAVFVSAPSRNRGPRGKNCGA